MTIAVLLTSAMGDALLALPLIQSIRAAKPGVRIAAIVSRPATVGFVRELYAAGALPIDEIIELPEHGPRTVSKAIARGRSLAKPRLETVVQTFSSHGRFADIVCLFSGSKRRAGFQSGILSKVSLNLRPRAIPANGKHRITLNLSLCDSLGVEKKFEGPDYLKLPKSSGTAVQGDYVMFSIFADRNLQGKRWPMESWAKLGQDIVKERLSVVVSGGEPDRAEAQQLVDAIGNGATNLAGTCNFVGLAGLMRGARMIVGTDGMPLHYADALGLRVVGLFGPTDPVEGGPYSAEVTQSVILQAPGEVTYTNLSIDRGIGEEGSKQMLGIHVEHVFEATMQALHSP